MKQIFFTLCLIAPTLIQAQSISFSPSDTLEETYDVSEYPSEYIYVKNMGSSVVTFNFDVLKNTIASNGWSVTLCTNINCFPNVPSSGTLGSVSPSQQGFFNPHAGFKGITGTGELVVRVYEKGNPTNADTLTFRFHSQKTAGIARINENFKIKLYPNPTVDQINLNASELNENSIVTIYSSLGKLMYSGPVHQTSIDVSHYTSGQYILHLVSDGETYISKFVKR